MSSGDAGSIPSISRMNERVSRATRSSVFLLSFLGSSKKSDIKLSDTVLFPNGRSPRDSRSGFSLARKNIEIPSGHPYQRISLTFLEECPTGLR